MNDFKEFSFLVPTLNLRLNFLNPNCKLVFSESSGNVPIFFFDFILMNFFENICIMFNM